MQDEGWEPLKLYVNPAQARALELELVDLFGQSVRITPNGCYLHGMEIIIEDPQ